ncbi:MAG: hypothetical protein GY853_02090 [PVC group bacterium]|nr:hypothetical protein [PVC group bacterium]
MIKKEYRIKYKYGDTIKIKPISDIHYGNTYCDVDAFRRFLAEDGDNVYYLGIGDLYDSILPSDPRYVKHGDALEGTAVIDHGINDMCNILEPYKDRIIGLGRGNHESQIIKRHGTDSIERTCEKLGLSNLGYSGLLKLVMSEETGRTRTVVIRYHHGWGGGSRTQGADLTKFSKDIQYWPADVFLYGHVHRKQADRIPHMGLSGLKLYPRPRILCICGTFLKTYSDNEDSTYSEEKGYPPVEVGGLTLNIKPTNNWCDIWVDL